MLMRDSKYRTIRGLRHRQQRHHVCGTGWARSGWNGRLQVLAISTTRANETDMLMRNSHTGAFEVYDVANNAITFAGPMGQVGLEWSIAGFGDFSTRANETDMLMRNNRIPAHSRSTISAITTSPSRDRWARSGWNGRLRALGDFSGNANETDMLMRNIRIPACSNSTTSATTPSRWRPAWARSASNGRSAAYRPLRQHGAARHAAQWHRCRSGSRIAQPTHAGDGVICASRRRACHILADQSNDHGAVRNRQSADRIEPHVADVAEAGGVTAVRPKFNPPLQGALPIAIEFRATSPYGTSAAIQFVLSDVCNQVKNRHTGGNAEATPASAAPIMCLEQRSELRALQGAPNERGQSAPGRWRPAPRGSAR